MTLLTIRRTLKPAFISFTLFYLLNIQKVKIKRKKFIKNSHICLHKTHLCTKNNKFVKKVESKKKKKILT